MAGHPENLSKVGPYVLMETLGVGSFGKVKLAVHETTYERFACKILEKELVRGSMLSMQVQKEIEIMRSLKHKNTVGLVKVMSTSTKVFIVMDLIKGGELFTEILRFKRFSEEYARFYFIQLIDGVQYCHAHHVFHRDLKPENLLLDTDHTLKITDFGLSTLKEPPEDPMNSVMEHTQLLHTQCGSPNYTAPEIFTLGNEGYDGAKLDAWACGVILFVLVAGRLPFDATNMKTLFRLVITCDLTYPTWFSAELIDIINNLLRIDPKERYSLEKTRRHPWFLGPIRRSEGGPLQEANGVVRSPPPGGGDPEPDLVPDAGTNETAVPSLLTQQPADAAGIGHATMGRRADSLDVAICAVSVESQAAMAAVREPFTSLSPPATKEAVLAGADESVGVADSSRNRATDGPTAAHAAHNGGHIGGGYSDNLKASVPSSADDGGVDKYGVTEEAQQVGVPNGISGNLPANGEPSGGSSRGMRRVRSESGIVEPGIQPEEGGVVLPGARNRRRLKRQLLDNTTESWKALPQSTLDSQVDGTSTEQKEDRLAMNAYALANRFCMSELTASEYLGDLGRLLETQRDVGLKEKDSPSFAKPTGEETQGQSISSHTQGRSMTVTSNRQPLMGHAPVGDDGAGTSSTSPSASLQSSDKQLYAPTTSKRKPVNRRRRRKPPVTELTPTMPSPNVGSGIEWVRRDVDKVAWCRMMKDHDMVPDELEFGMDSAALSDMWQNRLSAENLGCEGTYTAPGSGPTPIRSSRSTSVLSSAASRSADEPVSVAPVVPLTIARELLPTASGGEGLSAGPSASPPSYVVSAAIAADASPATGTTPDRDGARAVPDGDRNLAQPAIEVPNQSAANLRSPKGQAHSFASPQQRLLPAVSQHSRLQGEFRTPLHDAASPLIHETAKESVPEVSPGSNLQRSSRYPVPTEGAVPVLSGLPLHMNQVLPTAEALPLRGLSPTYAARSGDVNGDLLTSETLPRSLKHHQDRSWSPSVAPLGAAALSDRTSGDLLPAVSDDSAQSAEPAQSTPADGLVGYASPQPLLKTGPLGLDPASLASRLKGTGTSFNRLPDVTQVASDSLEPSLSPASDITSAALCPRSDAGRSMNSDAGTGPSPSASLSSAALRSGGSDGLMSTPRDIHKGLSSCDGRAHGTISSGASSASGSVGTQGRNSLTGVQSSPIPNDSGSPGSLKNGDGSAKKPVSPFSLDIPGPAASNALPQPKPLFKVFRQKGPNKRFLRHRDQPLSVKRVTQFQSLMEPAGCFEVLQGILESCGCTTKGGATSSSSQRFKLKCEVRRGGVVVASAIDIFPIDGQHLVGVSFKRKSADQQSFLDFFSEVRGLYRDRVGADKSSPSDTSAGGSAGGGENTSVDAQKAGRRRGRGARVRFQEGGSSSNGTAPQTPQSDKSVAAHASGQTESADGSSESATVSTTRSPRPL